MSEPKRYLAKCPWYAIEMQAHPRGEFVLYSDYARLKAEVEKLRKGDERDMTAAYLYAAEQSKDVIARLKAKVQRLEDAGASLRQWAVLLESTHNFRPREGHLYSRFVEEWDEEFNDEFLDEK